MSVTRVPLTVVPGLVATTFLVAWVAGTWFALPAFDWTTPGITPPQSAVTANLRVSGMKCRKTSQKLYGLLFDREDDNRIEGYLRATLFPAPGAGRLEVRYDPSRTDLTKIAQAISLDDKGLETSFRVRIDLKVDLSSPKALLHSLALALEHRDEELFDSCHAAGARKGVDFAEISGAWRDLFLEDLLPGGPVDQQGSLQVQALSVGDRIPLEDLAPGIGAFVLQQTGTNWLIKKADWSKLTESAD